MDVHSVCIPKKEVKVRPDGDRFLHMTKSQFYLMIILVQAITVMLSVGSLIYLVMF